MGYANVLRESLATSRKDYRRRIASGAQPPPPDFVSAGALRGPLRFLDYTDDEALVAINAAYLLLVAVLYAFMKMRRDGFKLKGVMIVRPPAAPTRCGSRPTC